MSYFNNDTNRKYFDPDKFTSYDETRSHNFISRKPSAWQIITDHEYGDKPITTNVLNFLKLAHTGIPGEWNISLFKVSCELARCKWNESEAKDLIMSVSPYPLDASDIATIESGIKNGSSSEPYALTRKTQESMSKEAIKLIKDNSDFELFRDDQDNAYVTINEDDRTETNKIESSRFNSLLRRKFYEKFEKPLPEKNLKEVTSVLAATAIYEGELHNVFNRVALLDDKMYIDIGDKTGSCIEIDKNGTWSTIEKAPVKFIRNNTTKALPKPEEGGTFKLFKDTLFPTWAGWDGEILLILSFIIKSLTHDTGPYPVLLLLGGQGTGKSFLTRLIKSFIDPDRGDARPFPEKSDDLIIYAQNSHLLAFDNISGIKNTVADALCRLSTGSGFGKRTLYSNDKETIFNLKCPIILNGINLPSKRSDLLERSIVIRLPSIDQRLTEEDLRNKVNESKGKVFGFLLSHLAHCFSIIDNIKIDDPPRMADFAKWGVALQKSLNNEHGDFLRVLNDNQVEIVEENIEGSDFAKRIIEMVEEDGLFVGTSTDLLERLKQDRSPGYKSVYHSFGPNFPKNPVDAGRTLNRIAPDLKKIGYLVTRKKREIRIEHLVPKHLGGIDDLSF